MVEITINEKSCYGSDTCTSAVCEDSIPGIQNYVKEKGVLLLSKKNYQMRKNTIEGMVISCPASAITVVVNEEQTGSVLNNGK